MPTSDSSANGHLLALLANLSGQLVELALEPPELEGDDQHVDEHDEEDNSIGGCNVLLGSGHTEDHASSSRSSRRRESIRYPASSTWKSVAARVSIAASETQKVRNIGLAPVPGPQVPHEILAQSEPVSSVRAPKMTPWWIAT